MGLIVNATEAARLVGVSERSMRAWLDAGRFPTAKKQQTPGKGPASWAIDTDALGDIDEAALQALQAQRSGVTTAILARLDLVEQQLAALRERAPYLFAPVARSEGRQTALRDVSDREAMHPPESRYSAFHVAHGASTLPDGYVPVDRFAQAHGMRGSQRTTWLEAARDGRLPTQYNAQGWRHANPYGKVALVRYALDAEGRRVFCELWRDTEWFTPCEECPHE